MLEGVQVEVEGPTVRRDETNALGQANFASLQAGTYRLTFSGDKVTTFERETTSRMADTMAAFAFSDLSDVVLLRQNPSLARA